VLLLLPGRLWTAAVLLLLRGALLVARWLLLGDLALLSVLRHAYPAALGTMKHKKQIRSSKHKKHALQHDMW
jgi:hypothetical protein